MGKILVKVVSIYNPRMQILPVQYQKSSLLDKGSTLTFLVPDMVASMVCALDWNLPSTAQHQYLPYHIHYAGNSIGMLKVEGECPYI